MTILYFILLRNAIKYYLYSKKHISEHITREFDTILDPIFLKSLSSIDLVERRTKSYQNLILNGSLKIHLIDINYNLNDIYSLQLLNFKI